MSDCTTTFSKLVSEHMIEIGAGRPRTVSLNGHDLPILRVADVLDGRIESALHAHTPYEDENGEESKVSRPGDIVLTTKGTVGRVALMPADGPIFAYSPQLCFFRPAANGPLRSRFLYYWFKSPDFWIQAKALKGQTDMADFLSLADIQLMRIGIPSLDRQDAIVGVLGALDDKIAANGRILRLQDIWIRAVFDGLRGGMRPLGSIGSPVKEQRQPSHMPDETMYLGLEHVPRRLMWASDAGTTAEVTSAKLSFVRHDVLFGKLRPYFHKVISAGGSGVCSTDIIVVRAVDPQLAGFLLAACASDETVRTCVSASDGTRMPRTSWKDLASVPIPWPGEEHAREFSSQVLAKSDLAHALIEESRRLAASRDELLPLLMSGRIRVRDAEKVVEEVV